MAGILVIYQRSVVNSVGQTRTSYSASLLHLVTEEEPVNAEAYNATCDDEDGDHDPCNCSST